MLNKDGIIGFTLGICLGLVTIVTMNATQKEIFVTTNLDNVCVIDKEVMSKLMFVMKPAAEENDK